MPDSLDTLRAQDRLLIRTYAGMDFFPTPYGIMTAMPQVEKEVNEMANGCLDNLSTTLLPANAAASVYSAGGKTVGLLFDGSKVLPQHIASDDSNSHTKDDGSLSAHGESMNTLTELGNHCRQRASRKVNEVNIAGCSSESLVGIVALGTPMSRIEAAVAQNLILQKTGKVLPLVEYDQISGSLSPVTEEQLALAPNQLLRAGYSEEYQSAASTAMNRQDVQKALAKQQATETVSALAKIPALNAVSEMNAPSRQKPLSPSGMVR